MEKILLFYLALAPVLNQANLQAMKKGFFFQRTGGRVLCIVVK